MAVCCGIFSASGVAQTPDERVFVYRIGNSFTLDSRAPLMDQISVNAPTITRSGYHICGGANLASLAANTGCAAPSAEGPWHTALAAKEWDYLIMQPYRGSTLDDDATSIETFVAELRKYPANASTKLLLYQSWPYQSGAEVWSDWLAEPTSSATTHRQQYYKNLQAELQQRGLDVGILPNAEVLNYVRTHPDEFNAIATQADLYRDNIHMSPVGQFIAMMSVLTYVNGTDLTGLPHRSLFELPDADRDQLQTAVWKIVNATLNPGDFDGDGQVTMRDYDVWANAQGTDTIGVDANFDGVVDLLDYQIWEDAFAATTPEAGCFTLVAIGMLGVANRREFGRSGRR